MRVLKILLSVILLLVGLLFTLVAISVLSDHDSTGEPTNWLGFIVSTTIGTLSIALGVRTLYRLRAPSSGASRPSSQTSARQTPSRSSLSILMKILKGGAILVAAGAASEYAKRQAARSREVNYQCDKCGTAIQSAQQPSVFRCPNGGHHSWHNLGAVGGTNYQCSKCRVTIKCDQNPSVFGCPAGSHHNWNRL
jgi:DNA-directed RNA polymerase subunit RPC12/RpoP